MNRRTLLSAASTVGLASLAGCQVFDGRLQNEPPTFESVAVTGPETVRVGESVSLSVSVTNDGGRTGDFVDSLTVEGPTDSETDIRIEDVPASESRTVEVGPYVTNYAGEYRFRLADTGSSHTVSVASATLQDAEQFAFPDGVEIDVSDASTHASLFYDTPDGRNVLVPDDGAVLISFRASLANRSQQRIRTGPDSFDVAGGEIVTPPVGDGGSLDDIAGLDGVPHSADSIRPGETRSGWLLAEVQRTRVRTGLQVAWSRTRSESGGRDGTAATTRDGTAATTQGDSAATTRGGDSTPEVRWTFERAELPSFEIADLTTPGEVELSSSDAVAATVRNVGSTSGTYRGVLERRDDAEADWQRVETFERTVAPGGSATVTADVEASAVGHTEYRIRPGSDTEAVRVRPAKRPLGEQFTTPGGVAIRPAVGTDEFDGLFDLYVYEDSDTDTVRAQRENTFAFVNVSVQNTASEAVTLPDRDAFSVVVDGEAYSVFHSSTSDDVTFLTPIEGAWYAPTGSYAPGETHSGWLVFQIPGDATVADLTVRWSPNEDVSATWSDER